MEPAIILIVDDHKGYRTELTKILKGLNYRVDERANGREAIEAVTGQCPDIVLMDLNMPVIDGLLATRSIRALGGQYETLPIIALSAAGSEPETEALQAGCNRYFGKDQIGELISAIDELITNR